MNAVLPPYLFAYGAVVLVVVLTVMVYLAILHHPDTRHRSAKLHRSAKGGFFY